MSIVPFFEGFVNAMQANQFFFRAAKYRERFRPLHATLDPMIAEITQLKRP